MNSGKNIREVLNLLLHLQEVDQELEKVLQEEKIWPRKREELLSQIEEIQVNLKNLEEIRMRKMVERDRLQLEIQEELQRILTYERHLKEIKTNREYQALLHELGLSKKAKQDAEEALLQIMVSLEETEKEMENLKEKLKKLEQEAQNFYQEEQSALKEIGARKKDLLSRRKEWLEKIPPILIKKYEFVRKKHAEVVVLADNGTCSGCRRKLPPQLYILVMKEEEVISCPACQRLLFPPEKTQKKESISPLVK
jgi:hypothetical protein